MGKHRTIRKGNAVPGNQAHEQRLGRSRAASDTLSLPDPRPEALTRLDESDRDHHRIVQDMTAVPSLA